MGPLTKPLHLSCSQVFSSVLVRLCTSRYSPNMTLGPAFRARTSQPLQSVKPILTRFLSYLEIYNLLIIKKNIAY